MTAALGSFSRWSDRSTKQLLDIVEDHEVLVKAVLVVNQNLPDFSKLEGREARRQAMTESRETIREGLSNLLSEGQLSAWDAAADNSRQGRGGGRGNPTNLVIANGNESAPRVALADIVTLWLIDDQR